MKFFDVECEIHGKFEINANEYGECPEVCPICGNELKKLYPIVPSIYKVGGFTKKVEK